MDLCRTITATLLLSLIAACGDGSQTTSTAADSDSVSASPAAKSTAATVMDAVDWSRDYHSYAEPNQARVQHLSLDLTVDFDRRELVGSVGIDFSAEAGVKEIVLDTRGLQIDGVSAAGKPLNYRLAEADPHLGAALSIELPAAGERIRIEYRTSPDASGVQWLSPVQTSGKQHPFLFTQAQAIHARSFIPLQDTPAVRVTYDAVIRTPKPLVAVMSAANDPNAERDGVYEFTMPQAIPSYLIALAVGDLQFKPMGERTGVYAEQAYLDAAAKEFEDTESMLIATEKAYGPYSWDRYDLLILPPSFPFGGMENPRLSFITPTVLAGDKSLVALIAHELAHSWSGNTVTNATWRDLWLNEGFTTYLTYRIMEFVFGTERYKMETVLGYRDLLADMEGLDAPDERLAIDLRGRDPDAVFSNIPYEKGALFLRDIEEKIGRDAFDAFLMQYFKDFAFQSITTADFLAYLDKTLLKQHADKLDRARIEEWIFQPGIPANVTVPESDAFVIIDAERETWLSGEQSAADIDTSSWNFHQWMRFLVRMPEALSAEQLAELDSAFGLNDSRNNEIAHVWLLMSIRNQYQPAYGRLESYLLEIGRNKLVKPLYRELSKTADGKAFAARVFAEAKAGYHPLTVKANEGFVQ